MNSLAQYAWIAFPALFGTVMACIMIFVLLAKRGKLYNKKPDRRRKTDHIPHDARPGALILYKKADGYPGGSRGRIWTGTERNIQQQRDRNQLLRLLK